MADTIVGVEPRAVVLKSATSAICRPTENSEPFKLALSVIAFALSPHNGIFW